MTEVMQKGVEHTITEDEEDYWEFCGVRNSVAFNSLACWKSWDCPTITELDNT
jgi:hypothetical protein